MIYKNIKIVSLITLIEIILIVLIPVIIYFLKWDEYSFNVIIKIIKHFLFFSILKIIYLGYPFLLTLFLVAFSKKLKRTLNAIELIGLNFLLYLFEGFLFIYLFPQTNLFLNFEVDNIYSGFFYYSMLSSFLAIMIIRRIKPSLFSSSTP